MVAQSFEDIIQKYYSEGTVFRSQKRGGDAYYAIAAIDGSGFVVERLSADESVRCIFDVVGKKLELVRENGGHLPFLQFDGTTAVQMGYLQAAEFGTTVDRKEVLDLSIHSVAQEHFKALLRALNVSKPNQSVRLYKPIIIWCVLNAVNTGDISENRIQFDWLVPRFLAKAQELGLHATPQQVAEAFFHLSFESFWLLAYHDKRKYLNATPSATQIRDRIKHASFKETYWQLLSDLPFVSSLLETMDIEWFAKSAPNPMAINLRVLDAAVEKTIRPVLIDQGKLKDPKFEGYLQSTILPKVKPVLQISAIEGDPVGSLQIALGANVNLLSRFEKQWADEFAASADPGELRSHLKDLLFGTGPLDVRIRDFSEWSKPRELETGKKSGIQSTVIGYLLGFSNPDKYAFCKPNVYSAASAALLPPDDFKPDTLQRLAQATDFYRAAFELFTTRYHLPFVNLLDVHSAFYIMKNDYHGSPGWDQLTSSSDLAAPDSSDLNIILYGPPGTGKTYDSALHAVRICDGEAPNTRSELMARYRQLQQENRIGFVTFHQSYGYEDFVEGIRPVLEEGSRTELDAGAGRSTGPSVVRYECRPGVLKTMCTWARSKSIKHFDDAEVDLETATIWKMSLGDTQIADEAAIYDECIEKDFVLLGYGEGINYEGCKSRNDILAKLQAKDPTTLTTDYNVQAINFFTQEMAVGDLIVVSDGNLKFRAIARVTGPYRFLDRQSYRQMRPVEWLAVFDESLPKETINEKKFSQMTLYRLRKKDLKLSALKELISRKPEGSRNHVLIIDEINRGNISKILGELITLLEPDKRLGAENELTVTLPYSGDTFGVPSNLYLVGTMNTADRSIAFLDVALRRRFRFVEMMPDSNLIRTSANSDGEVEGVDIAGLLDTLNDRIELLYDREHLIGHSFFFGINSLAQLRDVFRYKVIPLLQEYFYGDWQKICFVLACPFDEMGKPTNKNANPIIKTRQLSAAKLGIEGVDVPEDKISCGLNPAFVSAKSGDDLRPFFEAAISGKAN